MSEPMALFTEHDRNWSWFERHYDKLVEKFDGQFVAVYSQEVVDRDKKMNTLMKRIRSKYTPSHVFVQSVSREKLTMIHKNAPIFQQKIPSPSPLRQSHEVHRSQ